MKHLIISRELPPANYPAGGIGTYVANIAPLLAERGDTVHLIGERWAGAREAREVLCDGRMIIHRIGVDDVPSPTTSQDAARATRELQGLQETVFPQQWFAWSAAFLAERLVQEEGIDVIEAQEWEAPLYYFLLRRSLGLGPERQPPCIVHLHSPTVFIHHYNGPAVPSPGLASSKRMEAFCIQSADALLCPSRRLAADSAKHFRVQPDTIEVIPLPVGFTPRIDRDAAVWSGGSICFVGRLEPRKGVIEWVEAATRVARENPDVHFDFVGADNWGLQKPLQEQIGEDLAARFHFHGPKPKAELAVYLARAKAGVVPSRWENFPNVCVEAMASGLPVIATRFGGMTELIEDGRTGWLAEDTGIAGMTDSLVDTLRRCLATPAEQRAAMGAAAADAVRRICGNEAIVQAHQKLRARVARQGALRSSMKSPADRPVQSAHVVVRAETLDAATEVLQSLAAQTMPASAITVVHEWAAPAGGLERLGFDAATQVVLHCAPTLVGTKAWNQGVSLLGSGRSPDFWLFLDQDDSLDPDCLRMMAGVFAARPDVGVVTPWTDRTGGGGRFDARPQPALAYQMIGNDISPASGFRAEAIGSGPPFRPGVPREHDVWALSNDLIAKGWAAVTLPCLLARRGGAPVETSWLKATALRAIRAEALAPFDTEENRLALQIVDAYVPVAGPPAPQPSDQKGLRRLAVRALEAILFRPRRVLRICLAVVTGSYPRGALRS